ncbi:MAG: hypothetical protein ACF8LL_05085 [Phycisphaerales bacterium]
MNRSYALAALLSLLATIVRTWDGQNEVLPAAVDSLTDQRLLGFFHLTWYLVTVVLGVAAVAFGYLSARPGGGVAGLIIGVIFILWSATIALVSTAFVWHSGTVVPMIVTLTIGVLALIGARRRDPRSTA